MFKLKVFAGKEPAAWADKKSIPLAAATVGLWKMSGQNHIPADIPASTDLSCASSFLVCDWFHGQFPAWGAEFNLKQVTSSQSLMAATIPESPQGPKGMVHFKSILDPLWSAGDMASLRAAFPWVLLVLSPFERFYELDPALDELSAGSPQLVIWRPDRPSVAESARLRVNSLVSAANPNEFGVSQAGLGGAGKGIRQLLTSLYVHRGSLIVQGVRHPIYKEMGNLSLAQYLAACLACLASSVTLQSEIEPLEAENLALKWSALLCGHEDQSGQSLYSRQSQALAWAARHIDAGDGTLLGRLQSMPEPFLTTRFRDEAKSFDTALERIQQIFRCLRNGEIAFIPAMAQVAQTFNGDEARLLRWKDLAEDLPRFLAWLPAFERAYGYLVGSFRTAETDAESHREMLLAACDEPHRFLEAAERERFDDNFSRFKAGYVEYYHSAHEEAAHILANQERMKTKVDSVALPNLELLSDLHPADKKYLIHVRAIGRFMQANQCDLPVRDILDRQPRCYCNFNPAGNRLLLRSVDRMNKTIQEGTDHCRSILRKYRKAIIQELENMSIDDPNSRQIAALLCRGPMIPLKQPAIDILNSILRRHPEDSSEEGPSPVIDHLARVEEMSDFYAAVE